MNRIITILVTIFILLLLYIWISHVWGSDKPKHPQQIVDATQSEHALGADDSTGDIDTFLNTSPDEVKNETEKKQAAPSEVKHEVVTELSKPEPTKTEPVKTEQVKTTPVKKEPVQEKKTVISKTDNKSKAVATAPPPAVKPAQPIAKKTSLPSTLEGKHLVIAGNFLQKVNA
ncbi:MAG: hypothetical protein ABJC12_14200, partial [Saprospiraceae bacterium]